MYLYEINKHNIYIIIIHKIFVHTRIYIFIKTGTIYIELVNKR